MSDNSFYTSDKEMPVFASEALEPFAVHCIGMWFSRCEIARKVKIEIEERLKAENREPTFNEHLDMEMFFRECTNFWYGVNAINKVSIATKGAVHFSLCIGNDLRRVATYIKDHLGFSPLSEKEKAIECGFIIK